MEIWKDVEYYEGIYQISNLGRVKSLARKDSLGRNLQEKILSVTIDGGGYFKVGLSKEGKMKTKKVHQLVAIAFLNHEPCGYKLVVNHIDFDRTNNNVNNLEIVTQRENTNLKHVKSSSRYTGVSWKKRNNKWQSNIMINGKKKYLGLFDCEISASRAYQTALNEIT